MAVPDQTPYKEYVANGTTTIFPLEFDCDSADHLIVKINDEIIPALNNWSLNTVTGSVVFNIAPINESKIILKRDTPLLRDTDYATYNNSIRPQPVNSDFDRIWRKLQEVGVTNWLTDSDIKNLNIYVDSLNDETREDFFNKLGNLEQNTNAMLQEAIANGTVSALAITTVETIDELDTLNKWDGRTVYVKGVANFKYDSADDEWVLAPNTANSLIDQSGKSQQELNMSSIYTVGSVAEMLALNTEFRVRTVRIKATGAMYIYDPSQATVNDGFYILNGWVLVGYNDRLLATLAGLKGDGTNEYTKLKSLIDVAASLNLPIDLCRLYLSSSNLVASGPLKFIGTGGFKLHPGLKGTLLTTTYNLEINGKIEVDQNKDNNAVGPVTAESDCAIKHSGDSLILKGVVFKPSASVNISTRPKKQLICEDLEVDGGQINLYVIPAVDAKVTIDRGLYQNAGVYDNIQIISGSDISITNITSRYAARSGIVVSNETKKARLLANLCYGNKKDAVNQGGWGIVCSVNTQDTLLSNNILIGNQVGGISMDTFPDSGQPSLGSRLCLSANIIYGLYEGSYGVTGISLNDASNAILSTNYIFKVAQGIHTDRAHFANISTNTIQDVTAYFLQLYRSDDVSVGKNTLNGCSVSGAASINCIDSSRFNIDGPTLRNLTGASGSVLRVSGTSKDWTIQNLDVVRSVAGSGYIFNILGSGVSNGVIKNCTFKGLVNASWQWFIASDNIAQFSSFNNTVIAPGTNYIYQGSNCTAGDDLVNGVKNLYAAAPTFKSVTGQIAVIAGAVKYFNGSAWA